MVGSSISHYKILSKLGEGGMGVVYKAEDLDLKRIVALKFLSREMLGEEEIKARLIREAQAAASLDHPNITTVHGIHQENGETFLAMAFIDGPSLSDKIKERPLPLEEALDIAVQIAEGLKEAHGHEVVHRDIKPSNVMLDRRGRVKIMDFGLAAVADRTRLTKSGTTLGTPAYMSPEQAQGQAVDHRMDIWSLGVVLYELLTGKHPFAGEYEQAVVYSIINETPEPVTAQRRGVPPKVDDLLNKALAKDRDGRYQHADDMIVDLRAMQRTPKVGTSTQATLGTATVQTPRFVGDRTTDRAWVRPLAATALILIGCLLGVVLATWFYSSDQSPELPLRRFAYEPPGNLRVKFLLVPTAISPNGRHIAAGGGENGRLWIQDLDQQRPREIDGAEGALSPFWSPDSSFIGFAAGTELMKVSVQGGLPVRVCELPGPLGNFAGGTWSPDGETIVFSVSSSLYGIPSRGGEPELLTSSEESGSSSEVPTPAFSPHFLPRQAGRRVVLFTSRVIGLGEIMLQDLDSGRRETLGEGHQPVYLAGHIVYQFSSSKPELWALPFSLDTLTPTGEPFPFVQAARSPTATVDGTLVYFDDVGHRIQRPTWFDRRGTRLGGVGNGQNFTGDLALSPDGRRLAVSAEENGNQDIWVHDIELGVKTRVTTNPGPDYRPIWSPNGEDLVITPNNADIELRRSDGSGDGRVLLDTLASERGSGWSRDGRYIFYDKAGDLWYLERTAEGSWDPHLFLQTPFQEYAGSLSPDGRFIAYSSDESGQDEIYVQPFPDGGLLTTISSNGGSKPRWSPEGGELFYVEASKLMAVSVDTSGTFEVRSRTPLFEHPNLRFGSYYRQYDVSADGKRFIIATVVEAETEDKPMIRVVQNWYEEFRDHK